ncbi:DNA endonuclease SmrA [Aliikangiella maris]|uniref:DNA endonuclease SmrA n=2 Tax=Aliikangiella maris TaxID=3162458 RepID=A0ABV2BP57_9GAMM
MTNDSEMTPSDNFLEEMAEVKPLEQDKVLTQNRNQPEINNIYRQKMAESFLKKDHNFLTDGEVVPVEPLELLSFKLDGVQPGVFKKLRQGKYDIDYHLDLHRKTVAQARHDVYQLLRASIRYEYRTIMITHGKGLQSNPPARLKSYVNHWLKQVEQVIAFHSAIQRHGGVGSVYVLLKKSAENTINPSKYN